MLPFAIGVAGGAGGLWAMYVNGMLRERSGSAVLLMAIAAFYPVFAVWQGSAPVFHIIVAVAFIVAAAFGFRKSTIMIASAIAAHGVFDFYLALHGNAPGPSWWPAFCAGVDVTVGAGLLYLVTKGKALP